MSPQETFLKKVNKFYPYNQVTGELYKNMLLIHVLCSRERSQTNVNPLAYYDENEEVAIPHEFV